VVSGQWSRGARPGRSGAAVSLTADQYRPTVTVSVLQSFTGEERITGSRDRRHTKRFFDDITELGFSIEVRLLNWRVNVFRRCVAERREVRISIKQLNY